VCVCVCVVFACVYEVGMSAKRQWADA
jgi:hypothetical protein